MASDPFWMEATELVRRAGTADSPLVIDCRRAPATLETPRRVAGARWSEAADTDGWLNAVPRDRELLFYCVHGHNVSQMATALARAAGRDARALRGGLADFASAGGATLRFDGATSPAGDGGTWVIDRELTVDGVACAWLTRRFIDTRARIVMVEAAFAGDVADELGTEVLGAPDGNDDSAVGTTAFERLVGAVSVAAPGLDAMTAAVRASTGSFAGSGLSVILRGHRLRLPSEEAQLEAGFDLFDSVYADARASAAQVAA